MKGCARRLRALFTIVRIAVITATTSEPSADLGDLEGLRTVVGEGVRVVGLGEAAHGGHEVFQMKARLFRFLAERLGFRERFTEGRSEEEWLRHLYNISRQQAAKSRIELPVRPASAEDAQDARDELLAPDRLREIAIGARGLGDPGELDRCAIGVQIHRAVGERGLDPLDQRGDVEPLEREIEEDELDAEIDALDEP